MALHNREKMINNREEEDSASPTTPPAPQNHPLYTPQQRPSLKSKALDLIPWILLFAASYIFFRYTMNSHTSGSPAAEVIKYEPVRLYAPQSFSSPYQGWPTDAKDQMWLDMYENGLSLAIDKTTHRKLLHKSEHVPVRKHESEYLVSLGVFHQLRCLDMLRQSIYPTRYNTSLVNSDGKVDYHSWSQLDACVESLRQSLTCSADVTTVPFEWRESKIMKPKAPGTRMCRNFADIQKWAFKRSVSVTNKRTHVEDGIAVDYAHFGTDPDVAGAMYAPSGWDKTAGDL